MKDKYISYYELLGMIKEGNIPKRLYVKIANYGMYYIADYDGEEFSFYKRQNKDGVDENYHFYLSECFLESSMFEKCIQVLDEEEFEDIEEEKEIELYKIYQDYLESNFTVTMANIISEIEAIFNEKNDKINQLIKNQKKIIQKLNKEN